MMARKGNAVYRKITSRGEWYAYERAVPIGGKKVLAVTLELTDGVSGDADGIVNGVIDDPSGLVFPLVAAANIPTLSEWARIVLISLFNLFGVYYKRNIFS